HAVGTGGRRGDEPARRFAGIAILRRVRRARGGALRAQARFGPQGLFALVDLPELVVARVARLEEMGVDRADERHIGGIEPDDAVIAFVDVTVPDHRRGPHPIPPPPLPTPPPHPSPPLPPPRPAVDDGPRTLCARG